MTRTTYKRNWVIWKFDGYYDVHYAPNPNDVSLYPEAEGFYTVAEAKQWITEAIWIESLMNMKVKIRG